MKKKIFILIVLLIVIAILIVLFLNKNNIKLTAEVEATMLPSTSEVSGKIIEMPIELGQNINKGDIIAIIDKADYEYSLKQLKINLEKTILSLNDMKKNTNENNSAQNEINIANSNYNTANAEAEKAQEDYERALSLYNDGAISKNELENAKLSSDLASYSVDTAKAKLNNAENNLSESTMQLDIENIENQIQQAQEKLEKYTITAAKSGIVMSKNYVLGDIISPGYNLADISVDDEKYLVFYLPKELINKIQYDQNISFKYSGKIQKSKVRYIDVTSEYTPKDFQTTANKNKESVKIKLLLSKDTKLKPGEKAEIIFSK
ncbi:HlyD family secretion protein [Anaerovorax odorimutans]|uniref:HlyD family secretion protein n=1 Tax=Anaerovorax odorimutans TaxID=109327 RepID=UPI00040FA2BB|nr:biotin/lipoyl-binding protein [Anaerovorax odorimutans]